MYGHWSVLYVYVVDYVATVNYTAWKDSLYQKCRLTSFRPTLVSLNEDLPFYHSLRLFVLKKFTMFDYWDEKYSDIFKFKYKFTKQDNELSHSC